MRLLPDSLLTLSPMLAVRTVNSVEKKWQGFGLRIMVDDVHLAQFAVDGKGLRLA